MAYSLSPIRVSIHLNQVSHTEGPPVRISETSEQTKHTTQFKKPGDNYKYSK